MEASVWLHLENLFALATSVLLQNGITFMQILHPAQISGILFLCLFPLLPWHIRLTDLDMCVHVDCWHMNCCLEVETEIKLRKQNFVPFLLFTQLWI